MTLRRHIGREYIAMLERTQQPYSFPVQPYTNMNTNLYVPCNRVCQNMLASNIGYGTILPPTRYNGISCGF